MKYVYNAEAAEPTFGALPAGDFSFVVAECGEPFLKPTNNWVLAVRLAVGPERVTVFDNPWARSSQSETQDGRDGIAKFLNAIGMAPPKGKDPDWAGCIGKKGKLKLKVEIAAQGALAGKEVNKVDYYYTTKEVGFRGEPSAIPVKQNFTKSAFQKARAAKEAGIRGEPEPDEIPY